MKKMQGDLIFRTCDLMPEGVKKVEKIQGKYILRRGEATGHSHVITDDIEVFEKEGVLYLKGSAPFQVEHEEHKSVELEEGYIWRMTPKIEVNPEDEEIREVRD